MFRTKFVAVAACAGLVATACGGSYDRQEFLDELIEGGLDETTATCIVDATEAEFGEDRLAERGDLTAEEEDQLTTITFDCVAGDLGG